MKVAVWDTYVTKKEESIMHFDIIVPVETSNPEQIFNYGREYLKTKGQGGQPLTSKESQFCHIEALKPEWEEDIRQKGYSIVEMENCHSEAEVISPYLQYINPEGLFNSPAFSQVVTTQGKGKTIYIGGQNAVNAQSEIVGKGDISEQTEQVMQNIGTALAACGATFANLVKLTIHIVQGEDLQKGFQASQKYLGELKNPPAITGFFVSALTHPDFLVEIDAIAFLPEG